MYPVLGGWEPLSLWWKNEATDGEVDMEAWAEWVRTGFRDGTFAPRVGFVTAVVGLLLLSSVLVGVVASAGPSSFPTARSAPTVPLATHSLPPSGGRATPASGGVGTVIDTLDLPSNRLLAGNQAPAPQGTPQMLLFDPGNGNFYVRGNAGQTISVVNASTDAVLTSLTVGYGGSAYIPNVPTVALDPATGDLFETNPTSGTVGVISTSTNLLTHSVPLGTGPGGIVFDPANGNFYTSNWYSDNVSVISGSTDQLLGSIHVGGEPGAILYDPNNTEVFVSNFNTGNVSVINSTTESVVANPRTGLSGSEPLALTLNTANDLVYVVNSLTNNITVINGTTNNATATVPVGSVPTSATYAVSTDQLLVANGASNNVTVLQLPANTAVASIAIGHGAQGAVYDPHSGDVYTANYGSNNVSILDPSTDTWVGAVTTGNFPEEIAVDLHDGNVYVANLGTDAVDSNLTVISGTTSLSIGSVGLTAIPTSLTAVPGGNLYAIDYGGSDAYIISESTNHETGVVPAASPEPTYSAFDTATDDLYITSEPTGAVNVVTTTGTVVATLNLGFGSDGVAYDPSNGEVYVCNYYSGNVTIIDGTTETVHSVITVQTFDSLGAEIYDPADSSVYVADYLDHNVTVVSGGATDGSIQVGTDPSSFAYDPQNDTIFVANYGSNNISVINATTNQLVGTVSGYYPDYLAYDSGTNSVYVASAENGEVDAFNASTYLTLGSPLMINSSVRSGGIAYGATSGDIYVTNEFGGSLSVISSSNVSSYPVTFVENGLPSGTSWGVTLGGTPNLSTTPDVGFTELNGSYPFSVGSVTGYVANVTSGNAVVAGKAVTVFIGFTPNSSPNSFPVQFNETGLPTGTQWGISLTPSGAGSLGEAAPSPILFELSNASYSFHVGAVSGYTSSPSSGPFTVAGLPVYVDVTFTAASTTLTASLTIDPSNLTLGSSTTLTTSASGGAPPYSYVYAGLPAGCTSSNVATFSCTPTVDGTFTVAVTVTDHNGTQAVAHASLTVHAPAVVTTTSGSSSLLWIVVAVVVILAVLLLLFFFAWRRRKKDDQLPPPSSSAAVPPPPTPPPGST
jgi:YVTN family beta-propeller protein